MLAANIEKDEVINIACGECTSLNQLWKQICEIAGINIKAQYCEARKGDIRHSLANITRAKTLIGYEPGFSITGGLEIALDWYKEGIR